MKRGLLFAAALVGLACVTPTDVCGCTPAIGVGTVAGVITRASGAFVSGAEVRVDVRTRGCALSQPSEVVGQPLARTDSLGRYRVGVQAIAPSDSACIRVVARAGGDSSVADGIRMRLSSGYGTARLDSIRVDLRLP